MEKCLVHMTTQILGAQTLKAHRSTTAFPESFNLPLY